MSSGASSAKSLVDTRAIAEGAKRASRVLATLDEAARNAALEAMARAVEAARAALLRVNADDVRAGGEGLGAATLARLKLDEGKLAEMVEQVRSVARLP